MGTRHGASRTGCSIAATRGTTASGLAKRGAALAKAAIYLALLWTTISILRGAGSKSGGGNEQKTTGGVLGWPAGRELVFAVAVGIAVAAGFNVWRGITRKFEEKLHGMSRETRKLAVGFGVAGHVARGVVFAVVAWFLAKAEARYREI